MTNPSQEINTSRACSEDLIFSYPLGKKYPLYVCSDAKVDNIPLLKAYHIVPFRKDFLLQYASWEKSKLERIEFNEYLRFLEKNIRFGLCELKVML